VSLCRSPLLMKSLVPIFACLVASLIALHPVGNSSGYAFRWSSLSKMSLLEPCTFVHLIVDHSVSRKFTANELHRETFVQL